MRSDSLKIARPIITEFERNPKFEQSAIKLHWANLHAHYVSLIWENIVKMHYDAATGGDVQLDYPVHQFLLAPPMHVNVALHLGDCIRNLRSALDYLVSELARWAGLSDEQIVFPFSKNRAGLEASFNPPVISEEHRRGRKAGAFYELSGKYPNLKSVILDKIAPYEGGDGENAFGDVLWRIITSDNVDKHRLMTPSVQEVAVNYARMSNGAEFVGFGTIVGNCFTFPEGTTLDQNSDFSLDITFQEPTRLAGKPVTSTLIQGIEQVTRVIEIFRHEFDPPAKADAPQITL